MRRSPLSIPELNPELRYAFEYVSPRLSFEDTPLAVASVAFAPQAEQELEGLRTISPQLVQNPISNSDYEVEVD